MAIDLQDTSATELTLVGRRAELAAVQAVLLRARSRPTPPDVQLPGGLLLGGAEGVGKTRLARQAVVLARELGFDTSWVSATRAAAGIPFGAVAHLLPAGPSTDRVQLVLAVAHRMATDVGDRPTLLVVDDAHLLDPASAALVHHLVLGGAAFVLSTVRSDAAVPEAFTSLWKDGLSARLDLGPLDPAGCDSLVAAHLGGPVDAVTLRRLWDLAQGNPSYLREVLRAGLAGDQLTCRDGVWSWHGPLVAESRLVELLAHRLGGQPGPVQELVDLVALAEPVALAVLERAGIDPAEVEDAESAGLLTTSAVATGIEVRLAQPLVGEVARGRSSPLHRRRLSARLARAADDLGRDGGDGGGGGGGGAARARSLPPRPWTCAPRSGTWTADCPWTPDGCSPRPGTPWRSWTSRWPSGWGARPCAPGPGPRVRSCSPPPRCTAGPTSATCSRSCPPPSSPTSWPPACWRCGCGTWSSRRGGMPRRWPCWGRRPRPGRTPATRSRWPARSCATSAATSSGPPSCPPRSRAARMPHPGTTAQAGAVLAQALAVQGRHAEASAAGARALRGGTTGWSMAAEEARGGLALAHLGAGRLADVQRLVDRSRELSVAAGWHVGAAMWASWSGELALARGRPRTALAQFREAAAVLADAPHPYRDWLTRVVMLNLVRAAALTGCAEVAADAAARYAALDRPWTRVLDGRDGGAPAWLSIAQGEFGRAVDQAVAAADTAAARGQRGWELGARHLAVRLGAADRVCAEVVRLGRVVDGPLAAVRVQHTLAAAGRDGAGLEVAAADFADLGHHLLAAEAWAQATGVHRTRGRLGDATRAAAAARAAAARCEGARSPALATLTEPSALTRRETEIARLAAGGRSNREIAGTLVISVRTVDNTLHQVYSKLGLSGRRELQPLFAAQLSGSVTARE